MGSGDVLYGKEPVFSLKKHPIRKLLKGKMGGQRWNCILKYVVKKHVCLFQSNL
jgi:hypothetical protein